LKKLIKAHKWYLNPKYEPFSFLKQLKDILMADRPTYEELEQRINESGIIRKSIIHTAFLLVVIVCVFICPPAYAEKALGRTGDKYKILIPNSYHKEFEWTDDQLSAARGGGLRSKLKLKAKI